jgi:hypothetical protein
MDKEFAIRKAGGIRELAALLGVTRQRVHQFAEGPLPRKHQLELKEQRPRWFAEFRRLGLARRVSVLSKGLGP